MHDICQQRISRESVKMPPAQLRNVVLAKSKRPDTYSEIQAEIGQRIKWARELVEPNRAEFARTLGVDRSTLQKIEDGTRAPSVFNILEISHILRISPDYILTGNLKGVDGEIAGRLVHNHPELLSVVPSAAERTLTLVSPKIANLLTMAREKAQQPPELAPNSNTDGEPPHNDKSATTPGIVQLPRKPKVP